MADAPTDELLREVLATTRTIALVGFSADPSRPSHRVARFLVESGYRVIPVNPFIAGQDFAGERVRARLADIPAPEAVDMVDIFRRIDEVPATVGEALAQLPGLRTVWLQPGLRSTEAAALAAARGLRVIQDRCPMVERRRLFGPNAAPVAPGPGTAA